MSRPFLRLLTLCLFTGSIAAACSSEEPPPQPATATTPAKRVDPATAGSLTGRATFTGTPPPAERLRISGDKVCVEAAGPNPQSDAVLVADDGGLKNAFVWVKAGLDPGYGFDIPTEPVVLDQKGCFYTPRVVGVRVGQPLRALNSDDTLHNVHALPMVNSEFNKSTPTLGSSHTVSFTAPEVMVRFKCDVHNWMAAWVGVVPHPFFAVTDASGAFDIPGLPPGTYTVEAWHETFGTRTAQVTIGDAQAQTTSFTFDAAVK